MHICSYATTLPTSPLISSTGTKNAVRTKALLTPPNLKECLIAGEDLMGIWVRHLNQDSQFSAKQSFTLTNEMTADDILGFCKFHGVHPAKESQVTAEKTRIQNVFEIDDLQNDGFFKRLMTNMTLISVAFSPSNNSYPVLWFK